MKQNMRTRNYEAKRSVHGGICRGYGMKIKFTLLAIISITSLTFVLPVRAQVETSMKDSFVNAATTGDVAAVMAMLETEPKLANAKNGKGQSVVLLAAYYGKKEIVALLLKTGIDLDIFEAAATGQTERVRSLIAKHKKLLNSYSQDGFFPLGLAIFFGHTETALALLDIGADVNIASQESMKVAPLHSAVAAKQIEVGKRLIALGANVNARAENDIAPLHEAAMNGDLVFTELLLKSNADINPRTKDGKTPLKFALDNNHGEVAKLLRVRGGHE